MDIGNKSDPFVQFQLGYDSKKTSIAKNQVFYDFLGEEYELEFDPAQGRKEVDVEVYDYDSVGSNDFIGSVSVDVW